MNEEAETFCWEPCPGCGNGLWKRYSDRLEMTLSPRGGQKRLITVRLSSGGWLRVVCEKCGQTWSSGPHTSRPEPFDVAPQ